MTRAIDDVNTQQLHNFLIKWTGRKNFQIIPIRQMEDRNCLYLDLMGPDMGEKGKAHAEIKFNYECSKRDDLMELVDFFMEERPRYFPRERKAVIIC